MLTDHEKHESSKAEGMLQALGKGSQRTPEKEEVVGAGKSLTQNPEGSYQNRHRY